MCERSRTCGCACVGRKSVSPSLSFLRLALTEKCASARTRFSVPEHFSFRQSLFPAAKGGRQQPALIGAPHSSFQRDRPPVFQVHVEMSRLGATDTRAGTVVVLEVCVEGGCAVALEVRPFISIWTGHSESRTGSLEGATPQVIPPGALPLRKNTAACLPHCISPQICSAYIPVPTYLFPHTCHIPVPTYIPVPQTGVRCFLPHPCSAAAIWLVFRRQKCSASSWCCSWSICYFWAYKGQESV